MCCTRDAFAHGAGEGRGRGGGTPVTIMFACEIETRRRRVCSHNRWNEDRSEVSYWEWEFLTFQPELSGGLSEDDIICTANLGMQVSSRFNKGSESDAYFGRGCNLGLEWFFFFLPWTYLDGSILWTCPHSPTLSAFSRKKHRKFGPSTNLPQPVLYVAEERIQLIRCLRKASMTGPHSTVNDVGLSTKDDLLSVLETEAFALRGPQTTYVTK